MDLVIIRLTINLNHKNAVQNINKNFQLTKAIKAQKS